MLPTFEAVNKLGWVEGYKKDGSETSSQIAPQNSGFSNGSLFFDGTKKPNHSDSEITDIEATCLILTQFSNNE